jgi:fructoselysine/glucoselysine PTS system EIID component
MANNLTAKEKKDIFTMWWRSGAVLSSMNPVKLMSQGYSFSINPLINELYKDKPEARLEALRRSNQFFNTHPGALGFILGLNYAMEKEAAKDPDNFDGATITNIKTSLMGPLAGIGDSLFYSAIRVIAASIGIAYAAQGNLLGVFLFALIFGGSFLAVKYYLLVAGYKFGGSFLKDLYEKNLIGSINKAASTIGLLMVGAISANMIRASTKFVFVFGESELAVQGILDMLLPKGLSMLALFIIYKLLKKGHSIVRIVGYVLAVCIVFAYFGIF